MPDPARTRVRAGDAAAALRGALGPPSHGGAAGPARPEARPEARLDDDLVDGKEALTSKVTVRLLDDELVAFDELVVALRRRLRRPVTKAELVRAWIVLTGAEEEVLDAVAAELTRATWRRRDVTAARRRDVASPPGWDDQTTPAPVAVPSRAHGFKPQQGNALRCDTCGTPKGRHR